MHVQNEVVSSRGHGVHKGFASFIDEELAAVGRVQARVGEERAGVGDV
jgi:hypothetical protein